MSVSRPARCLFSVPSIPTARPRIRCHNFHTSLKLSERRRPRIGSVKASDMGLTTPKIPPQELFRRYNDEEKADLSKIYTPEQLKAIEAGEDAIDPEDLDRRGTIRTDLGALPYLDDFSRLRPVIDKKPRSNTPIDPNTRLMTEDEHAESYERALKKVEAEFPNPVPEDIEDRNDPKWLKYLQTERLNHERAEDAMEDMMGTNGPLPWEPDLLAPALPARFMDDDVPRAKKEDAEEEEDVRDPDGVFNRLRKQTGYTLDDIFDLKVKILVKHRVVNQTRLGKIASLYCLAVAGNGKGRLGIGEAKGQETEETQNNARISAIRNMQPIPRYEERTIFGEVEGKVSAAEVKLMARPPGFGLRCQHNIFEMARAAGIHDLAARVPRSRNKMNTIKAAYQALMKQRIPDEIARGRGKKLVDVRKVYYGGRV